MEAVTKGELIAALENVCDTQEIYAVARLSPDFHKDVPPEGQITGAAQNILEVIEHNDGLAIVYDEEEHGWAS